MPILSQMDRINKLLHPIFKKDVFIRCDERIKEFGFSEKYVSALVLNKFEGSINSGMMMDALRNIALQKGVLI